jgi:hypothetical protein
MSHVYLAINNNSRPFCYDGRPAGWLAHTKDKVDSITWPALIQCAPVESKVKSDCDEAASLSIPRAWSHASSEGGAAAQS